MQAALKGKEQVQIAPGLNLMRSFTVSLHRAGKQSREKSSECNSRNFTFVSVSAVASDGSFSLRQLVMLNNSVVIIEITVVINLIFEST